MNRFLQFPIRLLAVAGLLTLLYSGASADPKTVQQFPDGFVDGKPKAVKPAAVQKKKPKRQRPATDLTSRVEPIAESALKTAVRKYKEEKRENYQKGKLKRTLRKSAKDLSMRSGSAVDRRQGVQKQLSRAAGDSVISLVVSAKPRSHLLKAVSSLTALQDRHGIQVSEILIVHEKFNPFSVLNLFMSDPKLAEHLKTLNASGAVIKPRGSVPKSLKVSSSPVWVVNYKGRNHVFEGYQSPHDLFDAHADFIGHEIPLQPAKGAGKK